MNQSLPPPPRAPLGPPGGNAPVTVPGPAAPAPADEPRRVTSEELLRGAEEVLIEHQSSTYRLRRTAQGKLILTK